MPNITSNTTETHAPDRSEVQTIGGVQCHYALKGNLDKKHSEQQDRASVFELPDIHPGDFKTIMDATFVSMKKKYDNIKAKQQDFVGNCCATTTLFDPLTGELAIGSKGDATVYMVLQNKKDPKDVAIKRISSPFEEFQEVTAMPNGNHKIHHGPNFVGFDFPVMWATAQSWKAKPEDFVHSAEGSTTVPNFELIDVKQLAQDILQDHAASRSRIKKLLKGTDSAKDLKDYTLSIVMASDGIMDGPLTDTREEEERRCDITDAMRDSKSNVAQSILDHVARPSLKEDVRAADNLSAVVLHDIQFGAGNVIATCICDGNHKGKAERINEGSVAAQAMITTFERVMEKTLARSAQSATSEHRASLKKDLNREVMR